MPPKGDVCLRESSPDMTGLRADGIILLADGTVQRTSSPIPPWYPSYTLAQTFLTGTFFAASITTEPAT
jgi:hypothetical protein